MATKLILLLISITMVTQCHAQPREEWTYSRSLGRWIKTIQPVANAEKVIKESTNCAKIKQIKETYRRWCKGDQNFRVNENDLMDYCSVDDDELISNEGVLDKMLESAIECYYRRGKRSIANHAEYPDLKWPGGIISYYFDGSHDEVQMDLIRGAIDMWESKTCLRFVEVPASSPIPRLLMTNDGTGCVSFIGKIERQPQTVFLPSGFCFQEVSGTIAHELGHAIGLWHTHQRPDRDSNIQVILDNVISQKRSNFDELPGIVASTSGLPYDYTSIMHYDQYAFSLQARSASQAGLQVLLTDDPLYQQSIGQRSEISYYDYYKVNMAYCNDTCDNSNTICVRGYKNPNDCNTCICPDGFSGPTCANVASPIPSTTNCGAQELRATREVGRLQSPGYPTRYDYNIECAWRIATSPGYQITVSFEGEFGVYVNNKTQSCFHWIEIKYKADHTSPGPRFCGPVLPAASLTSDTNEVYVIFKSNFENAQSRATDSSLFKGFSITYQSNELAPVDPCDNQPCLNGGGCNSNGNPLCSCPPNFSGTNCDITPCTNNPCNNMATCHVDAFQPGGFRCDCLPGWVGQTCGDRGQCPVDACNGREKNCAINPSRPNSYYCECLAGYQGDFCQIDLCEGLCLNGGICRTVVLVREGEPPGQQCTCTPGWTGSRCETPTCDENACSGFGRCIPAPGNNQYPRGYYCECNSGFPPSQSGDDCTDPCSNSPCQNNGQCIRLVTSGRGYSCSCQAGFAGDNCESNPCDASPCRNNGQCIRSFTNPLGYTCNCPSGFGGVNCDNNPCAAVTCDGRGECKPSNRHPNNYYCDCFSGFLATQTADNCIDACNPNPCQNQGSCIRLITGEPQCNCPNGFTGVTCEQNPCTTVTCGGHGVCRLSNRYTNNYYCDCFSGFLATQTADNCIDTCSPNPCRNQGTCVKLRTGQAQCRCENGFTGDTCEQSPCKDDTCSGHGTCIASGRYSAGYYCNCYPNYTPTRNRLDCLDPCDPNPCKNGGSCTRSFNGRFMCTCPSDYGGDTCEDSVCRPGACSNHGDCKPSPGQPLGYYCECYSGFLPTDTNRRDCAPSACHSGPCQNGGTCISLSTRDHMCVCPSNYLGRNCQIAPPNVCSSNPCTNGGTCTSPIGSRIVQCSCSVGFGGRLCEISVGSTTIIPTQEPPGSGGPECYRDTCGGGDLEAGQLSTEVCKTGQMIEKIINSTRCVRNYRGVRSCTIQSSRIQVEQHYCCNGALNVTAKTYGGRSNVAICIKPGWTPFSNCPRSSRLLCGGCSKQVRHLWGITMIDNCKVFQRLRTESNNCPSRMCTRCSDGQRRCNRCARPGQCCRGSEPRGNMCYPSGTDRNPELETTIGPLITVPINRDPVPPSFPPRRDPVQPSFPPRRDPVEPSFPPREFTDDPLDNLPQIDARRPPLVNPMGPSRHSWFPWWRHDWRKK